MAKLPTTLGDRAVPRPQRRVVGVTPGIETRAMSEAIDINDRAVQGFAGSLQRVSENLYQAQDEKNKLSYANAKSQFLRDQIAIESSFDKDQDFATFGSRYDERIGKAKTAAAESISDPKYRAAFEADVGVDIARGQASISQKAQGKETDAARAGLNQTVDQNMQAALALPNTDQQGQARIFKATGEAIDASLRSGYITAVEAQQQKSEFAKNYAEAWLGKLPAADRLRLLVPQDVPTAKIEGKPLLPIATDKAIDSAVKGGDAEILKRIAVLESNGNPDATNPSGASGVFQFMPATAAQYGLTDPKDPKESAKAAAKLLTDNRTILRSVLGRDPTGAELYLAHQQGASGAGALLANPDKLAVSVLAGVYGDYDKAKQAIIQNGGREEMTAGQFSSLWTAKFNGSATPLEQGYEIPSGGYDFSKKTGTFVDYLPVDQRMRMIQSSLVDMKQEQDRARVGVQTDVNLSYADWQRNAELTGTTDPLNKAKILAAFPDERGVKLVDGLEEAAASGRTTKVVNSQTLAEDRKMLDEAALAASSPGKGSAKSADDYRRIAEAVKAKQDALASDPGEYVRSINPLIDDAWSEAIDNPADKHAFRSAIAFSMQDQKRIGLSDVRAMPKAVATAIVENVMSAAAPKDQLDALLQYADMGDPEMSRQVMSELLAVKGGLPNGSGLIVDIAVEGENRNLAERLWTELRADTSAAKMDKSAQETLDSALGEGIMTVLSGQAAVTGDFSGEQANQIRSVAEQVAKARGLLTGDYNTASTSAVADLTGQMAMIADDTFAFVYYPSRIENQNPGAMERGLLTLRVDAAKQFPPDPYSQATARDITNMAVWVNDRDGLSLMVPGSTRYLMHVTYEDAIKRGLEVDALQEGQKQWPLSIPKPDGGVEPMVAPQ